MNNYIILFFIIIFFIIIFYLINKYIFSIYYEIDNFTDKYIEDFINN